jgi:hypothetical protein
MFMLIYDILYICMLLICHCDVYHLVYERERWTKWIHDPSWSCFRHKKSPLFIACCFLLVLLHKKSQKHWLLILFHFINLQAVGAWQTPQLVGHAKLLFFYCRLFKEYGERTTFFQEFDINPWVTLLWKLLLLHHSALGLPMSGI